MTNETIYRITNDSYSNDAAEMTLDQLREMCAELGWAVTLHTTPGGDRIIDQNSETVGYSLDAIAEMDAEPAPLRRF